MIEIHVEGKKAKTLDKSGDNYSAVQVQCGTNILEFPLGLGDALIEITLIPRPETDLGLQTKKREDDERERIETTMGQDALDAAEEEARIKAETEAEEAEYKAQLEKEAEEAAAKIVEEAEALENSNEEEKSDKEE